MIGPFHYAAFAAGLVVASAGGWAWNGLIDNPAVIKDTRQQCVSVATQAALEAQLAAQNAAQLKIDALRRQYEDLALRRAAENAQIDRETQDDIAAFEAAGRSQCSVTVDNIDFLRP